MNRFTIVLAILALLLSALAAQPGSVSAFVSPQPAPPRPTPPPDALRQNANRGSGQGHSRDAHDSGDAPAVLVTVDAVTWGIVWEVDGK